MCQWAPGGQVTSNNNYYDNVATKKQIVFKNMYLSCTQYVVLKLIV